MTMQMDFSSKRVMIVTAGDSSAAAIASTFIEHGAKVAIAGESGARIKEVAGGVDCFVIEGEGSKSADCKAMVDKAVDHLGGLDVLVSCNNVRVDKPVETINADDWEKGFTSNIKSAFFCTQHAVPHLKESKGNIVNIASVFGLMAGPDGSSVYSTAMSAMLQQTRMSALWLAPYEVRVNCLCPGIIAGSVDAENLAFEFDENNYAGAGSIPLGRLGTEDDIANAVLFIASDYASFMTGSIIVNDGGRYAGN